MPFYPNSISSFKHFLFQVLNNNDLFCHNSLYLDPTVDCLPKNSSCSPENKSKCRQKTISIYILDNDNLNGFDQAPIACCGGAYSQSWNHSTILLVSLIILWNVYIILYSLSVKSERLKSLIQAQRGRFSATSNVCSITDSFSIQ